MTTPSVFFIGASGTRQIQKGRPAVTARNRQLALANKQLDESATATPSLTPGRVRGTGITIMRVRVPLHGRRRGLYVVTLRGPKASDCTTQIRRSIGASPFNKGPRKGVVGVAFGPSDVQGKRWCNATYHGTVTFYPQGYKHGYPHRLFARFSFHARR